MGWFKDIGIKKAQAKTFKVEVIGVLKNGSKFSIDLILVGSNKTHIKKQIEECEFHLGEVTRM